MAEVPIVSRAMTLKEARDHVYFLAAAKPSVVFPSGDVDRLLNMGFQHVAAKLMLPYTKAEGYVVAGDTDYPLVDPILLNAQPIVSEVTLNGEELELGSDYELTGEGVRLLTAPTSTLAFTVTYLIEFQKVTGDNDVINLPSDAVECAILYAVYMMKLKDDEYQSVDRWKARFDEAMRQVVGPKTGVYKGE